MKKNLKIKLHPWGIGIIIILLTACNLQNKQADFEVKIDNLENITGQNNITEQKNLNIYKKMKIINKAVNTKEFKKLIESGEYVVIDLRTLEELKHFGIISGMDYHLDVYNPNDVNKLLNLPKNKKYLIYCYHGNRSGIMREYMISTGFNYVIDLEGGTDAWIRNGEKLIPYKN